MSTGNWMRTAKPIFAAFRHAHPEPTNGNEALNAWRNQFFIRPQTGSGTARPFLIDGSQPFMESRVTQGQQIPGSVRPDVAPESGLPEPQTDEDRREFLLAARQALLQGGNRALIAAKLARYGLSLEVVDTPMTP